MEFQLTYFKDDAVKVLHSVCQQIWKTLQWPQATGHRKRSIFIPNPKKGNAKECSNYRTIALSHTSKVMLKILQARLQQYMNFQMEVQDVQDVQSGFRKGRRTRDQIASICWVIEKAREFQKNVYFCQSLTMWITANCGKFFKRWDYQTTLPASWEICMQVKKQQLEPDVEQQTGSK